MDVWHFPPKGQTSQRIFLIHTIPFTRIDNCFQLQARMIHHESKKSGQMGARTQPLPSLFSMKAWGVCPQPEFGSQDNS